MTPLLEMKAQRIRLEGFWMAQEWGVDALSLVSLLGPAVTTCDLLARTAKVTATLTHSRLPRLIPPKNLRTRL